ncbi:F-box only 21 isoform X1 [Pelobates cultripes]|uniref:F-box only 21 isoform X1 n=2 Tax=Pelobates cultripes TaxID=61616 RepID=A0AAD1SD58_PELCU|nr:F-box only 21 isoform X1 [Pelobates cultripes]
MAASAAEGRALSVQPIAASPGDGSMEPGTGPLLVELPGELLEQILCSRCLDHRDIISIQGTCRRLRELCPPRGKVWRRLLSVRWTSMMKYYNPLDSYDWLEEYKTRHRAGLAVCNLLAAFSKRLITERHIPCEGFNDFDTLGYPTHYLEDELLSIMDNKSKKCSMLKYCAKKILYSMRQETILCNLKSFLQQPVEKQPILEGAVLIDQYCNPLEDISLDNIQAQLDTILEKVKALLGVKNSRHPALFLQAGATSYIEDLDLQEQVLDALNHVLFIEMKFKGNVTDFYNPLNSYIHQVLITKTGIPISLSVLYLYLAERLGVPLEPVNFPHHFMLRWSQGIQGSTDIADYVYVDAFGGGKRLSARDCEYMIGQHVTEEFYAAVRTKEVMQRMIGNLLNLGKRESKDRNFMLLRVSLDLYLAMYPDSVQHLLLQARLYFHLGIWPEKVLDILQNIQALDPYQHGAVAYLVQHTLEHIEKRKEDSGITIKLRSSDIEICYSIGLIMRHKRHGYSGVIFGWDPICMMPPDWIEYMDTHNLISGANQPFYSMLLDDGSCSYVAQENLELHPSPKEIMHPDIGLYFSEFSSTHYIGNEELKLQYPEDMEFTLSSIQMTNGQSSNISPHEC